VLSESQRRPEKTEKQIKVSTGATIGGPRTAWKYETQGDEKRGVRKWGHNKGLKSKALPLATKRNKTNKQILMEGAQIVPEQPNERTTL